MKEYTIIYKAEITEIVKPDETWSEDDAHVKDIKVFVRDI